LKKDFEEMMSDKVKVFRLLGILTFSLLCSALFAQDASVSGYVLRRGVVPMVNAHVSYETPAGFPIYGAYTDSLGFYRMSGIALSAPEPARSQPPVASLVTNSVGSSRSFYFVSAKPLARANIYDILGRQVATVDLKSVPASGSWISSGFWNGVSSSGTLVANGIYFATVSGEPKLRALKFVHLRSGVEGAPPNVTAQVLQQFGLSSGSDVRSRRRTLDDPFIVTIQPDSAGTKFTGCVFTRMLHDGDNGEVVDTVWSVVPHRILFVGNSYTYVNGGVDVHLRNLYLAAHHDSTFVTSSATVGGYTLGDHWNYTPTRTAINSGDWDVVVLQEQSQRPVLEPDSFYYYARLLNREILHTYQETAFYMTWARQNDPPMIEPLAAAYDSMGRELGALVSPCGRAFQRVVQEDTTINLYDSDGSHPSVWGTYLVCCVFYATLMQESPVGIFYVSDPRISVRDRDYLQTVAWDVVRARGLSPLP
jgi:hypothetical protein